MATTSPSITLSNATDAAFRTWVAAVITNLTTVGLTQTADTGQVDTATVLAPTAINQNRGVAIFTPNDGVSNYYISVGFGSGPFTLSCALYISVGWATDGNSVLLNAEQSNVFKLFSNNANSTPGATTIYFCKSDSAISIIWNNAGNGTTPNKSWIVVDRDRDQSTGNAQNTGVSMFAGATVGVHYSGTSNAITAYQHVPSAGGAGNVAINNLPAIFPRTTASWGRGGNVGIGTIVPWDGGMLPHTIGLVCGSTTDFADGDLPSISLYGTARTYRGVGTNVGAQNTGSRALVIFN